MSKPAQQKLFFRGVYEFEDQSGSLISAKIPASGSADLYSDTAVIVKPNQFALFVYKGQVADVLGAGVHQVKTENFPLLTKISRWKFGFQSPLRCELIFFSSQVYTSRKFGTPQAVLLNLEKFGPVPVRAFGNYNLLLKDPKKFYLKLMGSRAAFSVSDLEDFVQGQIVEFLPQAFSQVTSIEKLSGSHNEVSKKLEQLMNQELADYGVAVEKIQILSALPSKEVLDAIDAKAAIQMIGSQKEYLLYKAATSLGQGKDGSSNDPLQMMMGLMLGKGMLGSETREREVVSALPTNSSCASCKNEVSNSANFCPHCGKRLS